MDELSFTAENVITIGCFLIVTAGVYWRLALRVSALEADMLDITHSLTQTLEIGRETNRELNRVATNLAVLTERVSALITSQERLTR